MVFRNTRSRHCRPAPKIFRRPLSTHSFLSLVLLSTLPCQTSLCQERLAATYKNAQRLFEEGRDEQAATELRPFLEETGRERAKLLQKPRTEQSIRDQELRRVYTQLLAGGHNFLGLIAARHERFDEAARHFAEVRNLQPDFPDVDFNLGLALFSARQFSEAVGPLEHALQGNPSSAKIKKYAGLTDVETGQYEKGITLLENVREQEASRPPRFAGPGNGAGTQQPPGRIQASF